MKKICVICVICGLLSGCASSPESDFRRTRLVADENIRLKRQVDQLNKQLQLRDSEIKTLSAQVDKAVKELAALREESAATEKKLSASLQDYHQRLEECVQAQATAEIPCPELEAQYAEIFAALGEVLAECQKKLETYEQTSENVQ